LQLPPRRTSPTTAPAATTDSEAGEAPKKVGCAAWNASGIEMSCPGAPTRQRRPAISTVNTGVGLATLALLRDDPPAVLAEYEALLAAHPAFADAHLGRSWALVRLGRYAEASRALDHAERLGAERSTLANQRRWLEMERQRGARPTRARTP
jgi:hypothetical protein